MKFSSIAMLAIAATPFLSMVSAQTPMDLAEFLEAECNPPTPAPTSKGKGTKGEDRRQLQAKSGGKGSKSSGGSDSDDSGTCTGVFLATVSGAATGITTPNVLDACGLLESTPVTDPLPLSTIDPLVGGATGVTKKFFFAAGTLFPSSFSGAFENPPLSSGIPTAELITDLTTDCGFPVPTSTALTSSLLVGPRIVSGVINADSAQLIPFGTLTVAAEEYDIFYAILCDGPFDPSDISPFVADYLEAFKTGECPEEDEEESGKKA